MDDGGLMEHAAFDPGHLADVDRLADGDRWTLVFTRDLRHPPEKVWAALTDPRRLEAWAPFTADRDLAAAGEVTLTMIDDEEGGKLPESVRRAVPPRLLEYTWGGDLLSWELVPTAEGTRLTLRHTVDDPDWLSRTAAGWHLCLDVAERLLDGRPVPSIRGEDAMDHGWKRLNDAYAEKLGTTGAPESG